MNYHLPNWRGQILPLRVGDFIISRKGVFLVLDFCLDLLSEPPQIVVSALDSRNHKTRYFTIDDLTLLDYEGKKSNSKLWRR